MKNGVYLLLGSNLGNREENLFQARHFLQQLGTLLAASSIYQTQAWGDTQQPDFLNQVIQIDFQDTPKALLANVLKIENNMGRIRGEKWGARIIDIDILFYGQTILTEPDLVLPHPQLHLRRFTLMPLSELAPDFVHPVLNKSCRQLLSECYDPSAVDLYQSNDH